MRVYKPTTTKPIPPEACYSTRQDGQYVTAVINGKQVTGKVTSTWTMSIESPYYSLKFRDHRDIWRYLRAFTREKASQDLGDTITELMEPRADPALAEALPVQICRKLVEWEILDSKRSVAGNLTCRIVL